MKVKLSVLFVLVCAVTHTMNDLKIDGRSSGHNPRPRLKSSVQGYSLLLLHG